MDVSALWVIKYLIVDLPFSCAHIKFAKMYVYFAYAHKASFHSVKQSPYIFLDLFKSTRYIYGVFIVGLHDDNYSSWTALFISNIPVLYHKK